MEAENMQHATQIPSVPTGTNGDIISVMSWYEASITADRVLTCIPGTNPVNVPMAPPMTDMRMTMSAIPGSMMY